jgi:hypothetical protein
MTAHYSKPLARLGKCDSNVRFDMKKQLIIALCLVVVGSVFASTRSGRTGADVLSISDACESFRHYYEVYPPQESWFDELSATSNAVINTERVRFINLGLNEDSWGQKFVYLLPGKHNPNTFDLYSLGADGISQTRGDDPDDLANWHEASRWHRQYDSSIITPFRVVIMSIILTAIALILRSQKKD